jgi:hypothetical protein
LIAGQGGFNDPSQRSRLVDGQLSARARNSANGLEVKIGHGLIAKLVLRLLGGVGATKSQPIRQLSAMIRSAGRRFLQEHADTASEQADSAYADVARLTGHDPVAEILAKLRSSSGH